MKVFAAILLALVAVNGRSIQDTTQPGWFVPQINGRFSWMSENEWELYKAEMQPSEVRAAPKVYYYLYTKDNPTIKQEITADATQLKSTHFDRDHPTKFIIHGWNGDDVNGPCNHIRDAALAVGAHNIICVDWSSKAMTINYASAVLSVSKVGKQIAGMIDFLNKEAGMPFNNLMVAGHSLGAHVAGFAGKNVKNGRIHQITGLDPALPLFSYDKPASRLNQNDALYVESIQTNGGKLGFLQPIGKGTFYPNGGKKQPGCGIDPTGGCSHTRAVLYYAEAIRKNDFPSMRCEDYQKAVDKACGSTYSSVKMGASTNYITANGDFYVPVNKKSPFGKGS